MRNVPNHKGMWGAIWSPNGARDVKEELLMWSQAWESWKSQKIVLWLRPLSHQGLFFWLCDSLGGEKGGSSYCIFILEEYF